MTRRVVITGVGPITGCGVGMTPLWEAMVEGRSAIGWLQRFDPSGFPSRAACEVSADDFSVRKIVPKSYRKATKVMCRDIELAIGAADAAVADGGLVTAGTDADAEPTIAPGRLGCQIGAGLIAADLDELTAALVTSRGSDGHFDLKHWGSSGMENLTPLWLLKYLPNMLACHVTIIHDCRAPSNTITCCEASSALSFGESVRVIQRGAADACLTGGAESRLNPLGLQRQQFAGRPAPCDGVDDPTTIAKPFDPSANGTVIGEGGGILIVEALDSAEARGVTPYAEVVGFAATQSFFEREPGLDLSPSGEEIVTAMELAMDQAGVDAGSVDAIVPLGSSIASVDLAEANAIRTVFGEHAAQIPLITTVPFVGNCCAGNGAVSLSVAAQCLREQVLPSRLNSGPVDGLDAAACPSGDASLNVILVVTTSQGGQNAAVVLKKM